MVGLEIGAVDKQILQYLEACKCLRQYMRGMPSQFSHEGMSYLQKVEIPRLEIKNIFHAEGVQLVLLQYPFCCNILYSY